MYHPDAREHAGIVVLRFATPQESPKESGAISRRALAVIRLVSLTVLITQAATPAVSHRSVHGQLKSGKVVSGKVAAGVAHAYKLEVVEGQFVDIAYYQPGFPSILWISSAGEKDAVMERKLPGASGRREPIYWIAPRSGKFRIEISSGEPGNPALFKVELRELRRATPQDEKRI